jgi:Lon protease-like protein
MVAIGAAPQERDGYVGISISRPATAAAAAAAPPMSVPAFAELCRGVFGSARATGWYFSSAVSEALFVPPGLAPAAGEPSAEALAAALAPRADQPGARLPLFELDDVVLLPGAREELIIYEPRYRLMLRAALEASMRAEAAAGAEAEAGSGAGALFGVVSRGVGTAAALGGRQLRPDGRAHVVVHGGRRFRVRGGVDVRMGTFGLSVAEVEWYDDAPPADDADAAATAAAAAAALQAVQSAFDELASPPPQHAAAALRSVAAHAAPPTGDGDDEALSWALAALLPVGVARLRAWRDCTCTRTRLEEQLRFLSAHRAEIVANWARTL